MNEKDVSGEAKRKCSDPVVNPGGAACRDEGAKDATGTSECEMGVVAQSKALRVAGNQ